MKRGKLTAAIALLVAGCSPVEVDYVAWVGSFTAEPRVVRSGGTVTLHWESNESTASVRLTKGACPGRSATPGSRDVCAGEETIATGLPADGETAVIVTESTTFWCFPDRTSVAVLDSIGRGVSVFVID